MSNNSFSSSLIESASFDDSGLTITLKSGMTYKYSSAERDLYDGLVNAESSGKSAGQFFNRHIRPLGGRRIL